MKLISQTNACGLRFQGSHTKEGNVSQILKEAWVKMLAVAAFVVILAIVVMA